MKFKPGDKAVVVVDDPINDLGIGRVVTIVEPRDAKRETYTIKESRQGYYPHELEHEHVFNSPLYQALL